jgi:hypothetical protein
MSLRPSVHLPARTEKPVSRLRILIEIASSEFLKNLP